MDFLLRPVMRDGPEPVLNRGECAKTLHLHRARLKGCQRRSGIYELSHALWGARKTSGHEDYDILFLLTSSAHQLSGTVSSRCVLARRGTRFVSALYYLKNAVGTRVLSRWRATTCSFTGTTNTDYVITTNRFNEIGSVQNANRKPGDKYYVISAWRWL